MQCYFFCFVLIHLIKIYPVDSTVQLLKQLDVGPGKQNNQYIIIIVDPLCSKLAKATLANIEK